jgi:hypothetical protein
MISVARSRTDIVATAIIVQRRLDDVGGSAATVSPASSVIAPT